MAVHSAGAIFVLVICNDHIGFQLRHSLWGPRVRAKSPLMAHPGKR